VGETDRSIGRRDSNIVCVVVHPETSYGIEAAPSLQWFVGETDRSIVAGTQK